jgi:hypothetical protein
MLEMARARGIHNVTLIGERWIGVDRDGGLFAFQTRKHRWVRLITQASAAGAPRKIKEAA